MTKQEVWAALAKKMDANIAEGQRLMEEFVSLPGHAVVNAEGVDLIAAISSLWKEHGAMREIGSQLIPALYEETAATPAQQRPS